MSAQIQRRIALTLIAATAVASAATAQEQHHHGHAQAEPAVPKACQHHEHSSRSDTPATHSEHHGMHGQHKGHVDQHADQRTDSERAHVPPDPPQHEMGDMSAKDMIEMMAMDDNVPFGMALFDQLEWRDADAGDAYAWDGRVWYGNDYDKAVLKSEGERIDGDYEGSAELLWDHVIARWWSLQSGVSHDFGAGPSRTWATFGVQGLAPYWFEVEALLHVGEAGRTRASFSTEYEMFLTQRLVLQPKLEFDLHGKDDRANGIGSGFSEAELGLRLRYEIRREFAPYIGLLWSRKFGDTAAVAREHGDDTSDVQFVVGLRAWF